MFALLRSSLALCLVFLCYAPIPPFGKDNEYISVSLYDGSTYFVFLFYKRLQVRDCLEKTEETLNFHTVLGLLKPVKAFEVEFVNFKLCSRRKTTTREPTVVV